ncbi:MAG: OmpA family protein [Alphaproteobacteria bacterium]|nr:OmpA family protein [Alphaproteobacteria bacterium]
MKKSLPILLAAAMLAGCTTTNPYTGEQQTSKLVWGTALGTAAGAATGALVDKNHGRGALIGAATGAAVGGGVGYYLDTQEAELRAELESTGVRVVRDSDSIRLVMPGNITFNSDSADINSGFYPVLNSVAKVLNKYSNSTVMVMGYTDSTGTVAYNQSLSQQRAQSVASYLMGQGVKSSRFEVMGMGISNPIASNSTAAGRAQNRRVEIKIVPNK